MKAILKWLGYAAAIVVVLAGMAVSYVYLRTEPMLRKTMRTATPLAGRELGLMGLVARVRFVNFTDQEIRDLYSYLHSLGVAT